MLYTLYIQFLSRRMSYFLWQICTNQHGTRMWTLCGNFLSLTYMAIKALYLAIAAGNLGFVINMMGAFNTEIETILKLSQGEYDSEYLPSTVECQYIVKELGQVIHHAWTCTLPQNELNQMMMLFVGCWFLFLLIVNFLALVELVVLFVIYPCHGFHILGALSGLGKTPASPGDVTRFMREFLHRDGTLILRMIGGVSSDFVSTELTGGLWDIYHETCDNNLEMTVTEKKPMLEKDA